MTHLEEPVIMAVRLALPLFDGTQGPVQASQFIDSMNALFNANDIQEQRRPHMAMAAFQAGTLAHTWLSNAKLDNPAAFDTWPLMQAAIRAEFCRPWTLAESQRQRKNLTLQPAETANAFYNRIRFFHHTKDFHVPPGVKATQQYRLHFDDRCKEDFIHGLPQTMLDRLAAVDLNNVTNDDLVATVLQAQAVTGVQAPAINAINSNRFSRNKAGNQRQNNAGQQQRRPGPSVSNLLKREVQLCGRCKKMAYHRQHECFVPLDSHGNATITFRRERRQRQQQNRQRRQVHAVEEEAPQDQLQSAVQSYPDPLNALLG